RPATHQASRTGTVGGRDLFVQAENSGSSSGESGKPKAALRNTNHAAQSVAGKCAAKSDGSASASSGVTLQQPRHVTATPPGEVRRRPRGVAPMLSRGADIFRDLTRSPQSPALHLGLGAGRPRALRGS